MDAMSLQSPKLLPPWLLAVIHCNPELQARTDSFFPKLLLSSCFITGAGRKILVWLRRKRLDRSVPPSFTWELVSHSWYIEGPEDGRRPWAKFLQASHGASGAEGKGVWILGREIAQTPPWSKLLPMGTLHKASFTAHGCVAQTRFIGPQPAPLCGCLCVIGWR